MCTLIAMLCMLGVLLNPLKQLMLRSVQMDLVRIPRRAVQRDMLIAVGAMLHVMLWVMRLLLYLLRAMLCLLCATLRMVGLMHSIQWLVL